MIPYGDIFICNRNTNTTRVVSSFLGNWIYEFLRISTEAEELRQGTAGEQKKPYALGIKKLWICSYLDRCKLEQGSVPLWGLSFIVDEKRGLVGLGFF